MARATISGFDEVDKLLDKLDDMKNISMKAVQEAAPHLVDGAEKAVKASATKGYATGDLARSFVAKKAKSNKYGAYLIVAPVGSDAKGRKYYARGAYLEYGTTLNGRQKNPPQPWRDKAINTARSACEKAMEEVINTEVDKM